MKIGFKNVYRNLIQIYHLITVLNHIKLKNLHNKSFYI
jgi:hypothetical protein